MMVNLIVGALAFGARVMSCLGMGAKLGIVAALATVPWVLVIIQVLILFILIVGKFVIGNHQCRPVELFHK